MQTVYKYPIPLAPDNGIVFDVEMPRGAEIIYVGKQGSNTAIWAKVLTDRSHRTFSFLITGTGHPIPSGSVYVASWQDPPLVWHLWKRE